MKHLTYLANNSVSTIRLLELAIVGVQSEIVEKEMYLAMLSQELQDLREQGQEVRKPRGRPAIPTACRVCDATCPSRKAAGAHCVGKKKIGGGGKKALTT